MNRREAVKKSILLSSGAFLAPNLFAKDPVPKYKIGACDWSIKRMLELEAFRFGKQLGLDGIQFSFDEAGKGMDLRVKENREAVRQTIKKTGVAISSLAIGALNRIPFASTETGEQLVIDCIQTMDHETGSVRPGKCRARFDGFTGNCASRFLLRWRHQRETGSHSQGN